MLIFRGVSPRMCKSMAGTNASCCGSGLVFFQASCSRLGVTNPWNKPRGLIRGPWVRPGLSDHRKPLLILYIHDLVLTCSAGDVVSLAFAHGWLRRSRRAGVAGLIHPFFFSFLSLIFSAYLMVLGGALSPWSPLFLIVTIHRYPCHPASRAMKWASFPSSPGWPLTDGPRQRRGRPRRGQPLERSPVITLSFHYLLPRNSFAYWYGSTICIILVFDWLSGWSSVTVIHAQIVYHLLQVSSPVRWVSPGSIDFAKDPSGLLKGDGLIW